MRADGVAHSLNFIRMKRQISLFLCAVLALTGAAHAQERKVNYDEAKVPDYVLPEVLLSSSGKKIENKKDWEKIRRPELLKIFSEEMYGTTPAEKIRVTHRVVEEKKGVLEGKADRRQVEFTFSNGRKEIKALLLVYTPAGVKGKVHFFIGYNFKGNHSTGTDPDILYSEGFKRVKEPGHPDWVRGCQQNRWPVEYIISRGYGLATMNYHDIFPDKEGLKDHSIVSLFRDYNRKPQPTDEWQAIGAWAWGSSRILDYLEKQGNVGETILMGHSRQGKAALWAGAQDPRFTIVISNDSGSGGAALSRREYGETIKIVSGIKPAWFAPALNKYHDNEQNMPFDQHELIALMAPRPVYVASAEEDRWADPKGEFLSAYYASPVYALYGLKGIPSDRMPETEHPIQEGHIGYHIRKGIHDVTLYDWTQFMNFADMHLKR